MKLALFCVVTIGVAIGVAMPGPKPRAPTVAVAAPPKPTRNVTEPAPPQPAPPTDTVLEREASGHFFAIAEVNGEPVRFLVDTGATTVALSMADAERIGLSVDPTQFQVAARGASGDVRGQEVTLDRVELDGKRAHTLRAIVMEGAEMSLLGQNFLRDLAVEIKGDRMTLR
jgi:aspartyl protease family protein